MERKELFDVIPEIEELINFAKFEKDVEVPLEEGLILVRLSVLWEGEDYEIMKRSGELHNPSDMLSRGKYMKVEALVKSITKIGSQEYINPDKDKNEILKNNLRIYINTMNPFVVEQIYWYYTQLVNYSELYVAEKFEPLKKKFQESLKTLVPLSKPTLE
jgi:hypothetical protein